MATVSLRRVAPPAALAVGVAAVVRLVYDPWFLNYDARYALLWARDVAHGQTPDFTADFAPTPHPLQMGVSLAALTFGDAAAQEIVLWLILLAFGLLGWLVFRLGSELFGNPWVGAVAAAAVVTRPALVRDAALAYQDVPFAALIVGAVLLEARRPRRGLPVLALLFLAGLMRPEAWVLAGLYSLWLWPAVSARTRVAALAMTAAAPLLWAGIDALVTGDWLHSLHGTSSLAEAVDRRRRVDQVPYWTVQYFGFVLREPLVAAIPLGLAFAWLYRRRPAALPIAVAVAMTLVFAVGPLFGLPLIGRYIRTPATLLTLFYGLAVCGWLLLENPRLRRRWMAVGALAVLLSVAYLPWHYDELSSLERRIAADRILYADLRAAGEDPAVRAAFAACPALTTADHRPMPFIRWWLDAPPQAVSTVAGDASPMQRVFLAPRRTRANRRQFRQNFPKATAPRGYAQIYSNRSWRVDAAPECVARRPPS